MLHTEEQETIGAMLGIIAIAITKALRKHGVFLVKYSEDEYRAVSFLPDSERSLFSTASGRPPGPPGLISLQSHTHCYARPDFVS